MKLQNECNKGVRISYSCTNIYGKYAWVNPLKKQEGCDISHCNWNFAEVTTLWTNNSGEICNRHWLWGLRKK